VACIGERTGTYRITVGKSERKRPFGRARRRWEYNIKTDVQEIKWGKCELKLFVPGYRKVVGCWEHVNENSISINSGNFLTSC
jgi:hypothetical protein